MLNLYEKYKEDLFRIYPLSFHYFQTKKHQKIEATRLMEAKLKLLKEMGHIAGGGLTARGKFAKNVYGYELLLSELYGDGMFEKLDEYGLAVIAIASVFEPRKNQRFSPVPKDARAIKAACDDVYSTIKHREARLRVYPASKMPYFHLAKAIECWMRGEKFANIMQFGDTDEGEMIRYFRMAIQVLREISDAPISPTLKERVRNSIRLINRGIVDAEKQLREG
jgi:superfamily II RNA helicase